MDAKPRRIPKENVFVTRESLKGVTTLTAAKVVQRDHRKIKWHVTTNQQRHKKRVQPQL